MKQEDEAAVKAQSQRTVDGPAGESETTAIMTIRTDLVRKDKLRSDGEGMPQERLKNLRDLGVSTGVWWYADHPTHYRGDGSLATAEKGEKYMAARARTLATAIRAIKDDAEAARLQAEFFAASKDHSPKSANVKSKA